MEGNVWDKAYPLQVSTTRYSKLQIWPPFEKRDGGLITKKLECPLLCKTSLRITGGINEVGQNKMIVC